MRRLVSSVAIFAFLAATATMVSGQQPKDGFFSASDGVKIHYITLGDKGSWVVLIHGYSDSAQRMWFTTGIAPAVAKTHRVVAIDNRNHGQSDKPQPGGTGRAEDVIELMDHLKIQKAHIQGYSMGGGITGRLLGMIPDRFITAGFGGSGLTETDPEMRAQAAAMDAALPKAQGRDAEAMERFRSRVGSARPQGAPGAAGGNNPSAGSANQPGRERPAGGPASPIGSSTLDLAKITIPIIAINGSFDSPHSKTHRLWREARSFQNVILPEKTHLTAIAVGGPMPQQYIDAMVAFIDGHDAK